ncbi:MAG: hypothetical protein JW736_08085 [Deltaproteobacteria bacterium]|nr:hypothetical protein [Deltaproteobacteria bacterium]MBN2688712.1 hypothetical protein [Deltaproteobacteria bacterium]
MYRYGFRIIKTACLAVILLAVQGCAVNCKLSVSPVDASMDRHTQEALDAAMAENNIIKT